MTNKKCGKSLTTKDGKCTRDATFPDERCKQHTVYDTDEWKPNYEHGLYMERSGYYENLPEQDKNWIDSIVQSFVEQAPWSADNLANLNKLREAVVDMHKKRRADEYIHERGMAQTNTDGFHEQYGPIENQKENVLHITASRLSKDSLRVLKDLNCLPDEDNSSNDQPDSLIDQFSDFD